MAGYETYTLITGGSTGIGRAIARECASRGMNLLLVALDTPELQETARELREEFGKKIGTLGMDLTSLDGPSNVLEWCIKNGYRVDTLVNNAGLAGSAVFEESEPAYSDKRIMLNVRALVLLTRLFLPELKSHEKARILNTGSLSAYYAIAYKSVYAASKAFVLYFSRALKEELRGTGISVTVVNPNGVRTNPGTHGRIDTHGRWVNLVVLPAERIARIAVEGMFRGKNVIVPGFWNRLLLVLTGFIPPGIRVRRTAAMFRRELQASR